MTQVRIGDVIYNLRDWPTPDPQKCTVAELELGTITTSNYVSKLIGMSNGRWNLYGEEFREQPVAGTASKALLGLRGWCWLTDPTPLTWAEVPSDSRRSRRSWLSESITFGSRRFQVRIKEAVDEDEGETTYDIWYDGIRYPDKDKHHGCEETLADAQRLVADQVREMLTRRTP